MRQLPAVPESANLPLSVAHSDGYGYVNVVPGPDLAGDTKADILRYVHLLKKNAALILILTLLCTGAAALMALRSPAVYSASSRIWVNSRQQARISAVDLTQSQGNEIATDVNLIGTNSVLAYALQILNNRGLDVPIGSIAGAITVANVPGTDLINITAEWGEPKEAAAIADAVAQGFANYQKHQVSSGDADTAHFLDQEVTEAREKLAAADQKVQKFEETTHSHGSGSETSSDSATKGSAPADNGGLDQLTAAEGSLGTAMADRAIAQQRIADIQGKLAQENSLLANQNVGAVRDNNLIRTLQQQLSEKETELSSALAQYTPQGVESFHPGLQQEVATLRQKLHDATANLSRGGTVNLDDQQTLEAQLFPAQSNLHGLDTQILYLQQRVNSLRAQVAIQPALETRLNQLVRDRSVLEQIYRTLLERQKQVEISLAATQGNVTVVAHAETPRAPIRPERAKIVLLGFLFGLMAGSSIALLKDYLNNSVRNTEDVTNVVGLPLLGAIPVAEVLPAQVWDGSTRSLAAEAYRMLRSNISFLSVDSPVTVILVTSAGPAEGKSSTVANIAASMAQNNKRVVVIDADMRKPTIHRLLGGGRSIGLAEVLSGSATVEEAVRESNIPGVWTIPVDKIPPNPTELLGGQRMRDLLSHLREAFDTVIIDSPPCLVVADASVLASQADTTIQVIAAGITAKGAALRCRQILLNAHAGVVSAVLNRFDAKEDHSYDYYYYDYYTEKSDNALTTSQNGLHSGELPTPTEKLEP